MDLSAKDRMYVRINKLLQLLNGSQFVIPFYLDPVPQTLLLDRRPLPQVTEQEPQGPQEVQERQLLSLHS